MFKFLKKNKLQNNEWNQILHSRILPESEYYYSKIKTFSSEFVENKLNQTYSPLNTFKNELNKALYLSYAKFDHKASDAYFKLASQIANTILELPQSEIQRWNDDDLFTDLFKPSIAIDKLYLDALLTNETIDATKLTQLNIDLLEYLKTYKSSLWEDVTQSRYLSSVWHLMIAGDFTQAKHYLNVNKKFPYVQNLHIWTRQINDLLIAKHSGEDNRDQLQEEFDSVFDVIRQAYWKTNKQKQENLYTITMNPDYVRLQLAIIRWLYIEQQPLKGNWEQILAQVSK